jgi:hypothetical protein
MLKFQENFVMSNFQYINVLFLLQYYKQTQLETMVSEKAATEFQLEKEIKRLKEAQVCVWLLVIINFTWPAS